MTRLVHRLEDGTAALCAERGQTMAEYAVVLGVLIVAVAATVVLFANGVHTLLQTSIISILDGL